MKFVNNSIGSVEKVVGMDDELFWCHRRNFEKYHKSSSRYDTT